VPAGPETSAQHHHQHGGKKRNATIRERLHASDLYTLYTTLNSVKVDLLWGRNDEGREAADEDEQKPTADVSTDVDTSVSTECADSSALSVKSASGSEKGHTRRPSNVSMSSSNSTSTLSDSESDMSAENDSGVESEDKKRAASAEEQKRKDKSALLAKQFRSHLIGLYRNLDQMTEAANYLMQRYQSDFGPV
jgi:Thyroid hormone-inducible hepatic protein Spot 14